MHKTYDNRVCEGQKTRVCINTAKQLEPKYKSGNSLGNYKISSNPPRKSRKSMTESLSHQDTRIRTLPSSSGLNANISSLGISLGLTILLCLTILIFLCFLFFSFLLSFCLKMFFVFICFDFLVMLLSRCML